MELNLMAELEEMSRQESPVLEPDLSSGPMEVDFYTGRLLVAKKVLAQFQAEAEALKNAVFEIAIKDAAGSARAAEFKATAQKIIKRIDGKTKEIVEEPADYIQAVRNFAANLKAPLSEAKSEADRKIGIWSEYERQERLKQAKAAQEAALKLQAKINKDAQKAGIEPVTLPTPELPAERTVIRTDSGTTYMRTYWTWDIIDPDIVEREYCSPDPKKIKIKVDGGMRNPEMKGVNIYPVEKPVTMTK